MKIIKILSNFIFIVFIMLSVYFLVNYKMYYVASGSMKPTFHINELLIVKNVSNNEKYDLGDIITFYDPSIGANVTHRIVAINGKSIYTKGDYNNARDLYPVLSNNIIGKVVWNSYFLGAFLLEYKYTLIILLFFLILAFELILGNSNEKPEKGGLSSW